MKFLLSTASTAVLYSAWHMNLTMFSLDWILYCIAWLPLLMLLASAFKYDQTNKNPSSSSTTIATNKLNSTIQ